MRRYQLNQWDPSDQVRRTDFNEDNAKIEAALAGLESGKAAVVSGVYGGSGTNTQTISLGFTPSAVLLEAGGGQRSDGDVTWGGLMLPGEPISGGGGKSAEIIEGGFIVYYNTSGKYGNKPGIRYRYLAFR